MKELERRGTPTVSLVADHFVADHRRSAETMGLAELPLARMPFPFVNQDSATIEGMIDEAVSEIIRPLVTNVEAGESSVSINLPSEDWLTFEGADPWAAEDRMNQAFLDLYMGDGLPLRAPTPGRVDEMLRGTKRSPDEIVGLLEPGDGVATIRLIAVNAVMAGCSPKHLPLVIAAVECLTDPQMGLKRKIISTAPSAPMIIVNGPARHIAGLNHGPCMLGPGAPSHANLAVGRAVRLCLTNIGHTRTGISEMDTIGNPNKVSMVVAENEENSPWEAFHVDRGFTPEESTVTVNFIYGFADLQDFKSTEPEIAIKKAATGARYMGVNSTGHWLTGRRQDPRSGTIEQEKHSLLIAPEHAKIFSRAGWSKPDIQRAIWREARLPFGFLSQRLETKAIHAGHPDLAWLWDSPESEVPVLEDPECYNVFVAGSTGSNRSAFAWGMGGSVTRQVSGEDLDAIAHSR